MIAGLVEIFVFQGLGEIVSRFAVHFIPGPVIGLVLLLGWLHVRGSVPPAVDMVASGLTRHLGLLFVPAAVGVVLFWPHLKENLVSVVTALVGSVVLTIATAAVVLRVLAGRVSDES
ncbi:MAG TPA: CidA/LrgA family protein [Casimicrobiaceae bacterium]|nr:CidA/LrgA family protein [Casimicrobiaceae bacterium]